MKTYLVGGAVRDELLNRAVKDKDYVVVGSSPQQMLDEGFVQVGKDFPVFLHPKTKDEYALARTERKQGSGYHGFSMHFGTDVTLEQDLLRRDLTINAIAKDINGSYIDPYEGLADIEKKCLRHVSPAFAEDPLRVLRVARFAARYAYLGFSIADETMALMTQLSQSDELQTLAPERIWQETYNALGEDDAHVYFEVLHKCHALEVLFPEVYELFGIPQPPEHHPEIDSGLHTLLCLQQACLEKTSVTVRFAVLVHDLGKALTPKDEWPSHRGHEKAGVEPVMQLCQRLRVPKKIEKLAVKVCEFHLQCHRIFEMQAKSIVKLIQKLDGIRNPQLVHDFVIACQCDARGRTGFEHKEYPQAAFIIACLDAINAVSLKDLTEDERTALLEKKRGDLIAETLYRLRIKAVAQVKQQFEEE